MKNNVIPFPKTSDQDFSDEDDFCGADGFVPTFAERDDRAKLYAIEDRLRAMLMESERADLEFHEPESLTEKFKQSLLEVLHRRQRENVRVGRILTVSHPLMNRDEQVPFLAERSEIPAITVRPSTNEDLQEMEALRSIFPILADVRNGIRSNLK